MCVYKSCNEAGVIVAFHCSFALCMFLGQSSMTHSISLGVHHPSWQRPGLCSVPTKGAVPVHN